MAFTNMIKQEKTTFSKDELKRKFPKKRNMITDEVVELINSANNDPDFNGDEFVEAMLDHQSAMIDCKSSIPAYVNALKFVAYLQMCDGNATEAYKKARSNDPFVIKNTEAKQGTAGYKALTSAASRYRKNRLVQQLLTQMEMPMYLMFQKQRYEAVKVLATEMETAQYSRDRINAADKLLTHVKPPENMKVELDIGLNENTALQDLTSQLAEIVQKQKTGLEDGTLTLAQIGAIRNKQEEDIINAEVE